MYVQQSGSFCKETPKILEFQKCTPAIARRLKKNKHYKVILSLNLFRLQKSKSLSKLIKNIKNAIILRTCSRNIFQEIQIEKLVIYRHPEILKMAQTSFVGDDGVGKNRQCMYPSGLKCPAFKPATRNPSMFKGVLSGIFFNTVNSVVEDQDFSINLNIAEETKNKSTGPYNCTRYSCDTYSQ